LIDEDVRSEISCEEWTGRRAADVGSKNTNEIKFDVCHEQQRRTSTIPYTTNTNDISMRHQHSVLYGRVQIRSS
jgi:hypothetical protein